MVSNNHTMARTISILLMICILILSCGKQEVSEKEVISETPPPNILFVIADDMGKDATPNYSEGSEKPQMPTLEMLASSGITFDNMWAYPVCSPTRASIITGKLGYHNGVLEVEQDISLSEETLHDFIKTQSNGTYDTALIGKWHLSNNITDPNTMGIDHFSGVLGGSVSSYTNWKEVINGIRVDNTTYTTTAFSNRAIEWIGSREKPWFLWLAYNAPHTPFHLAPTNLHQQGSLPSDDVSIETNPLPYYFSAIEALDKELGRVIAAIPNGLDNTIVIFLGDNGTPSQVIQTPYRPRRAKGSIYQGGINVPMVIAGAGVSRKGVREAALIQSTDLFTTIAQMAGGEITAKHNSRSFYSLIGNANTTIRTHAYAEKSLNGVVSYAVRDNQYKLIVKADGTELLYDLNSDAYEQNNLLNNPTQEIEIIKSNLSEEAQRIRN